MRKVLLLLTVLAAVGGGAAYYVRGQNAAGKLDIQTVDVKRGEVRQLVATSGSVRALVQVEIGSQLSGRIGALNADFSTEVKTGEVLARIEDSTYQTKVREGEAAIAVAQAEISLQGATIKRAEANLIKAQADLRRAEALVKKGATSEAALDSARAAQAGAVADVAIANAQAENAKATLLQRQATLDSARIDLDRTYIRSPIDGVVIERTVEVGQTVAASLSAPKLFTIAQDLNKVEIDAQVDEADIGQVRSGNQVNFHVDAYPDAKFTGVVDKIRLAPTALQNVVTYTVVVHADNPGQRLLPGMTANVEIETGERENVIAIPNEALRFQPRGGALALARDPEADDEGGRPRGGGGRGGKRMLERLQTELKLPPEQLEKARAAIEGAFAARSGQTSEGTSSGDDAREQMRGRMALALKDVLTSDQFKQFQELQRTSSNGPRRGTIWTLEDDGSLASHKVRLGLADGSMTEITDGLSEGKKVVVRVREQTS